MRKQRYINFSDDFVPVEVLGKYLKRPYNSEEYIKIKSNWVHRYLTDLDDKTATKIRAHLPIKNDTPQVEIFGNMYDPIVFVTWNNAFTPIAIYTKVFEEVDFEEFHRGYLDAALSTSFDYKGSTLTRKRLADLSEEVDKDSKIDCIDFIEEYGHLLYIISDDESFYNLGAAFWRARNGVHSHYIHLEELDLLNELTEAMRSYGEYEIYGDTDGVIQHVINTDSNVDVSDEDVSEEDYGSKDW